MSTHLVRITAVFALVFAAQVSGASIQASASETIGLGLQPEPGFSPGYHTQAFAVFNVPAGNYDSGAIELTVLSNTWPPVPQPFDINIALASMQFYYDSPSFFGVADISSIKPVFALGQGPEVISAPVGPAFLGWCDAGGAIAVTSGPSGIGPYIEAENPVLILTSPADGLPLPSAGAGGLLLAAMLRIWRVARRWRVS